MVSKGVLRVYWTDHTRSKDEVASLIFYQKACRFEQNEMRNDRESRD
jgi:hypothetical protein